MGYGCFHRGSPLFPARSGALVVRVERNRRLGDAAVMVGQCR